VRLNCGKSSRYRPLHASKSCLSISVDLTASAYSFQARPATYEDAAATLTAATTSKRPWLAGIVLGGAAAMWPVAAPRFPF
jgi:hypothetical protein